MFLFHALLFVCYNGTVTIYLILYTIFTYDQRTNQNTKVKVLYIGGYAVLLSDFIAQTLLVFIFTKFGSKAVPH